MKVTFRKGGGEIRVKKRLLTPFTIDPGLVGFDDRRLFNATDSFNI